MARSRWSVGRDRNRNRNRNRMSRLPNELLSHIMSLLSTKDAARMGLSSKEMGGIFSYSSHLDFDDSEDRRISPRDVTRFRKFKKYVDSVLLQGSQYPHLKRFRLGVGDRGIPRDLEHSRVKAWICFPLTSSHGGIREIEISMHVRNPDEHELPRVLFKCETLEVLKLDVNLSLYQVCGRLRDFHLPNLKVFHLDARLIPEDGFVTRLVSSCPLLEELDVRGYWRHGYSTAISSTSLRRLTLMIRREEFGSSDLVHIDTPNLQFLKYHGDLEGRYSVTSMGALVEAEIDTEGRMLIGNDHEASFQSMLHLVKALHNAHHLSLLGSCVDALDHGELKNQLPVFSNFKHLELGQNSDGIKNRVLLQFLDSSPVLQVLAFPEGLSSITSLDMPDPNLRDREAAEFYETTDLIPIPLCCRSRLKRIEVHKYCALKWEQELLKYFLRTALVLEELFIKHIREIRYQRLHHSILEMLPGSSFGCSLKVDEYERVSAKSYGLGTLL